jgi:hypothetical protein
MVGVTIAIGLFLLIFLVIFALLINPPNAWVQKLTDRKHRELGNK